MADNKYAAIYARVSTEDQAKGYSLPTQVEECLALAKREGYTVPEGYIFQEDFTGTTLERPKMRKVRELVNTKAVSAVIVHNTDRLARDLGLQLLVDKEIERAGARLLFVKLHRDGSPEGQLFFHVKGALDQYERTGILERMRRGKLGRANAGYPNGGTVPLGYRYIPEPHKGRYEIEEEEAEVVRRVFGLCLKGYSTKSIALILSREGVPTKKDRGAKAGRPKVSGQGHWRWATIARILTYQGYTGRATQRKKKRSQDEWIEYLIPEIISKETFESVQDQLAKNSQEARRNRKRDYLFSGGKCRCGRCGGAMSGLCVKGVRYYRCSSKYMFPGLPGCKGYLRADQAEADIWQAVDRVLQNPELIAQEVARQQENSGAIQAEVAHEMELIESVLAKCDKEEKRWASAYAGEVIDLAELKGYKAEIATRRESLQGRRAELEARLEALRLAAEQAETLVDYCGRVRENLKSFSYEEKRLALEYLDIRVTFTPGQPLEAQGSIPLEDKLSASRPRGISLLTQSSKIARGSSS